jgi:ADP-ribosylglycohydrolase
MLGAIAGDIIGSIYEHENIKTKDFPLFGEGCQFTDDTVCTVAVADWLMNGGDLSDVLGGYVLRYPNAGYGGMFWEWANQWDRKPYKSWGNGSAMRVSPVAHFASSEQEALSLAEQSSAVTHSHPDAVAGAQATALTMWLARGGADIPTMRQAITERFGYDLSQTVDEIREWYEFDVSCAGTVPQAVTCALEAVDYEDAIRNAVSIGGDTDTVACITGGIAEVMFGLPEEIKTKTRTYLTDDLINMADSFIQFVRLTPDEEKEKTAWSARVEKSRRSGAYQRLKARRGHLPVSMNSLADTLETEGQDIEDKENMSQQTPKPLKKEK